MRNNKGQFVKGGTPWNKGKPYHQDSHHPLWKGNKVGYHALHSWITRKLGTPNYCTQCGTNEAKRFDWDNISGEYKRDLTDWRRLCVKCHNNIHQNWRKRWEPAFS